MIDMVPKIIGTELTSDYDIIFDTEGETITAFAGTGFNPDNGQHKYASSNVRYAIAIQQARDAKRYEEADAMREWVERLGIARVECAKDTTTIVVTPEPVASGRVRIGIPLTAEAKAYIARATNHP